ncbi:MAG TPA: hypothetical protein VFX16_24035 [Pseudonocardiaceae bacterium]|nr:hypothetical protein [Pseudonocardiaceae bacterium]
MGADPSINQTVSVPPPLTDGADDLPAHAGAADAFDAPPDLPPPLPLALWVEELLPQPAAASATVAAQTANRVTRFTVAVLPCPANILAGLV